MANLFYLPWAIVRDVAGVGIPGAKIYFTNAGGNIKKTVYQNSGLTTAHANPVICDGVGNPPIIYMNPAVSYRVRIYGHDAEVGVDTPIKDFNPYVPGIFADASALEPVADAAADSAAAAAVSAGEAADSAAEATGAIDAAAQAQAAVASITAALGPSVLTLSQLVASGMPLNARWFGSGSTEAEINLAITESEGLAVSGYGYSDGGPPVYVPYGPWTIDDTLTWAHSMRIFGDFNGNWGGGGTVISATGNFTGLNPLPGASGSVIERLFLRGDYTSTEAEAHAIDIRDKTIIRDVFGEYWRGDGINGDTFTHGTNINDSDVHGTAFRFCRKAYFFRGSDANALTLRALKANSCRQYALHIKDTIGRCLIDAFEFSTCGSDIVNPSQSVYNGGSGEKWYALLPDGNGANAPSGTTAHTADWYYMGASPGSGPDRPVWSGAIPFRSGGSIYLEGGSNYNTVVGGYFEGDQLPPIGSGHCRFVDCPAIRTDGEPYPYDYSDTSKMHFSRSVEIGDIAASPPLTPNASAALLVQGHVYMTRANGNAYDPNFYLNTTSNYASMIFQYLGVDKANIFYYAGDHRLFFTAPDTAGYAFRTSGGGPEVFSLSETTALFKGCAFGYGTNSGGQATQLTSKSTAVTLNKLSGDITMHNASLAANTIVSFTLNNSQIAAADGLRVWVKSGNASVGSYRVAAEGNGAGSRTIVVENKTAGALGEALVLGFEVVKGSIS